MSRIHQRFPALSLRRAGLPEGSLFYRFAALLTSFSVCFGVWAEPAAWQQNKEPLAVQQGECAAGLDFIIDPGAGKDWPRLTREMQLSERRVHYRLKTTSDAQTPLTPIDLGAIAVADAENVALEDAWRTWCGAGLVYCFEPKADAVGLFEKGADSKLIITASRLTPGVLLHADGTLVLFLGMGRAGADREGDALPAWIAAGSGGKAKVSAAEAAADLPLEGLGKGWLLVWYGQKSYFYRGMRPFSHAGQDTNLTRGIPADCPILILPHADPDELRAEPLRGIAIGSFEGPVRVVLLPLFGEKMLPPAETAKWSAGLPPEVVARCDWWAEHMRKYPVSATESYAYDAAADTVTVTETLAFEDFRDAGKVASIVPPLISVAALEGFPVEIAPAPYDPEYFTSFGSILAAPDAETYKLRFKGLGKYAAQRPAPAGVEKAPLWLREEINREVQLILDAGHLAPWAVVRKNAPGWTGPHFTARNLIHGNAGECLYFLAEALPFLEEPLRGRTLEYMRRERAEFPPELLDQLNGSDGARREWFELSAEFLRREKPPQVRGYAGWDRFNCVNMYRNSNYYVARKLVPPAVPYYLAAYYAAVGKDGLARAWPDIQSALEPYLNRLDWATGGWVFDHQYYDKFRPNPGGVKGVDREAGREQGDFWCGAGGVIDVNNHFAGAVGYIRLAQMLQDAEAEQQAWGKLARLAALRFACGKMAAHVHRRGMWAETHLKSFPQLDVRTVARLDQYGMLLHSSNCFYFDMGLVPLRDAVPELGLFVRDFLRDETARYYSVFTNSIPHWHMAWCEESIGFETNCPRPEDAYQTFMAHAWVLNADPAWLEKRLDQPWTERGDLYYLHKLAETARGYAGGAAQKPGF